MKRVLIILMMVLVFAGCGKSGNPVEPGDDDMSSPSRWTQTPSGPLALPAGRQETALNRVGCFQKMALEHEDGRTFVVMATESSGAPGTVYRLAVSESANTDKTWTGVVGDYNTAVETTIVNGYPFDEIVGLREWSADIRMDTIFITYIAQGAINVTIDFMEYNIQTQTFRFVDSLIDPNSVSCDISCSESGPLRDINKKDVGHGSVWVSHIKTTNFDPSALPTTKLNKYREFIPVLESEPQSEVWGQTIASVPVNARGLMSIFDGGSEIYSIDSRNPSDATNEFVLTVFNELKIRAFDIVTLANIYHLARGCVISGAIDASSILYDFGTWDACYIDFYNYQVQAKWIRASSNTGWDLYIGRRDQNGVFNAQLVKTVDYANIGLLNIETQAENVGAFPEVVLSTDEQGMVYCMFMYPDETNNDVVGGGLGDLNGNPYTNIEMVTMEGDQIYDPQNLDVQNVWNGFQDATYRSLKHMSTTHRTDSQDFDVPSDRRLWLTVRDNVNDTRIVLFRN